MTEQRKGTILSDEHKVDIIKAALSAGFRLDGTKIYAPSDMPINREIERLVIELAKVKS